MKTIFLMLLLLFVGQQAKSQTFSKQSSWVELRTNVFDDTFFEVTTYKVSSDTLINDTSYSKIFRNGSFYAALREAVDSKIYAYFPFYGKELLIYDFDWQPGKTLYHERAEEEGLVAQATLGEHIDSVLLLDGEHYKRVGDIIRGIGSTQGFFTSTFSQPTDGSQFSLLCFHIAGVLVYRNPGYASCDISTASTATIRSAEVKLYPNPSGDRITVGFPDSFSVDVFKLFDAQGALVKVYNVKEKSDLELDVRSLPKGVYIYAASAKNGRQLSGKIIVK